MHCLFDFGCKIRLSSKNNSPMVGKMSLKTGKSKPGNFCQWPCYFFMIDTYSIPAFLIFCRISSFCRMNRSMNTFWSPIRHCR